ncbi:hypothetical protein GGI19_005384 [Coemansia pectinata]|uniref:Uncharacterized protein n=1 Tax=Coemansia pectinata TaxID=1052879 RepID=A0A9W8GR49_9FUNG|nr:hypothetical protein GGI19_005384 [Coemansia pectinata]
MAITRSAGIPEAPAAPESPTSVDERIRNTSSRGAIYASANCQLNTLSERRIRQMSGAIRAKPDWVSKSQSAEICERWKAEAKAQNLTDLEVDYVFAELGYYASLHKADTNIILGAVDGVWCSDSLVDDETTKALKDYAAILENVPARDKDWHPNSNDQVLNLIHPSLFPLIYKRSSVLSEPIASPLAALELKSFGSFPGTPLNWSRALNPSPNKDESDEDHTKRLVRVPMRSELPGGAQPNFYVPLPSVPYASDKFCWLPSEFRVDSDGATTIESYINNLHPRKHAALYPIIGSIFSKFVPMLEQVVTDYVHQRGQRVVPDPYNWFRSEQAEPEDYDAEDFDERYEQWEESKIFIHPQPEPFVTPDRPTTPYCLRGRRLQAIVKMSNIELTPEKPDYDGGNWHVEAMANERIIATGIYYYDVENIAESNLKFREAVDEDISYEQNDRRGMNSAYGIYEEKDDDEVPLAQNIGHIEIKNGRCLVFPNIYQHQVSSFKLADPTKPGHRKILAFFFIDPSTRIPSTEIVPPQQQSWWTENVLSTSPLGELPLLVTEGILNQVDFPISLDEAKSIRLELMAERSVSNDDVTENHFNPPFYLCEH